MKLKPIAETDEELFDAHYNLNVKGPFFLAKAVIPYDFDIILCLD